MFELKIDMERYENCSYRQTFLFEKETDFEKYLEYQPIILKTGQTISFYDHSKNYVISSKFHYDNTNSIENSHNKTFVIDKGFKLVTFVIESVTGYDFKLRNIYF